MDKMPQARSGLIVKEVDGEVLVYNRDNNKAHCLNSTAAEIWKRCDGRTSLDEVCDDLSQSFGATISEDVVHYAISQFDKDELLERRSVPSTLIGAGMSRRQMMRRLGLAAAVAVPLVTTMVAPLPAQAASGLATGQPCCSGPQCQTQLCIPPGGQTLSCNPPIVNGTCA